MALWRKALHGAFSHGRLSHANTHKPFDYFRMLRNRFSHREPTFTRHFSRDSSSVRRTTARSCSESSSKGGAVNNRAPAPKWRLLFLLSRDSEPSQSGQAERYGCPDSQEHSCQKPSPVAEAAG